MKGGEENKQKYLDPEMFEKGREGIGNVLQKFHQCSDQNT